MTSKKKAASKSKKSVKSAAKKAAKVEDSKKPRIAVLIADDHSVVREGLASLIGRKADMTVVAEAGNGREAVELWKQHHPDVTLLDLRMPELDGVGAIKEIRDRQEPGGGWSQFGRTPPDAYATGMSLYALHIGGISTNDETYRKGIAFLLSTQYSGGAWLVKTHSFPQQRYFESGFPFGRHQWISSAGTSWATLAIAQTLPDKH